MEGGLQSHANLDKKMWSMWKEWGQTRVNLGSSKSNWPVPLWRLEYPDSTIHAEVVDHKCRAEYVQPLTSLLAHHSDFLPCIGWYTTLASWSATVVPTVFNFILLRDTLWLFRALECLQHFGKFHENTAEKSDHISSVPCKAGLPLTTDKLS